MDISGRFTRVSKTNYRDGVILVGFVGYVYPHDLTPANIEHIKTFCNMPNSKHTIFTEYPEEIEPAYPAVKTNFKNGFLLLEATQ